MPQNTLDDKLLLVQVMAWHRQSTKHYLSQCSPRCLSPYGVTSPQWVEKCLRIMQPFRWQHMLMFVVTIIREKTLCIGDTELVSPNYNRILITGESAEVMVSDNWFIILNWYLLSDGTIHDHHQDPVCCDPQFSRKCQHQRDICSGQFLMTSSFLSFTHALDGNRRCKCRQWVPDMIYQTHDGIF